ncbi:9842_t:CDS:2 [Acaulospora morrowiae]|uniref:9842_t:CDS:1 n=1 Tax=Acaulospora morrowiae TaxID=94023 RepID=A0A9N9GV90_9GLOM|nr:9842_t:CDS:2 [Acaulospora morrowiae]
MAGFTSIKDAIYFSILVSGTNFLMTGIALFLIDKIGRRRILLYTIVGTAVGLAILGVGFVFVTGFTTKQNTCFDYRGNCGACIIDDRCGFSMDSDSCVLKNQSNSGSLYLSCPSINTGGSWFTLVSLVIFVTSYALGLGHVPWTVQSELFPLSVRGRAVGLATATNWLANLGVAVSFLPLTEVITISGTFWIYAIFMVIGWIFVYTAVPETAGKSLEEIQELFLR